MTVFPLLPPHSVVFMGCPDFAVPSLDALHAHPDFRVTAVYCMPDRPKGRGHRETMTPVKKRALELGLPVLTPASFRRDPEAVAHLRGLAPRFLVVVAYGLILPREVLEAASLAPVNLHASLLPRYRGPSPIHHAILNGDPVTGNTVMVMNEKMDEGDILAAEDLPIGPDESLASLHDRLAERGAPLLVESLRGLAAGDLRPRPQDHAQATYTAKITPELARLDWAKPAGTLRNLVRAMTPCPGAWTEHAGERLKIGQVAVGGSTAATPGTILRADPATGLQIACGEGTSLEILVMQRPGKSPQPIREFLRGFSFRTPVI